MIDNITISSKIDSTFEFEMVAQGISLGDANVLFKTDISEGLNYDVRCTHVRGDRWTVTIPKGLINNGAYNFTLCVIVDDYYFEPVKGMLRVVSEEIIQVFGVDEDKKEKPAKKTPKKTKKAEEVTETDELVKRILGKNKPEESILPDFLGETVEETEPEIEEPVIEEDEIIDAPIIEETVDEVVEETVDLITEEDEVTEKVIEETEEEPLPEEVIEETITPVSEVEVTPTPALIAEDSMIKHFKKREDANEKVKSMLEGLGRTVPEHPAPEIIPEPTIEVTGTQEPGQFFEELDKMKDINKRRAKNKVVRDAIKSTKKKD